MLPPENTEWPNPLVLKGPDEEDTEWPKLFIHHGSLNLFICGAHGFSLSPCNPYLLPRFFFSFLDLFQLISKLFI
jgi:hypothetical protein